MRNVELQHDPCKPPYKTTVYSPWWTLFLAPQSYFAELETGWILWSHSDIVDSFLLVISLEAHWKRTQGTRTVLTAQGSNLPAECTWQLPWYFLPQSQSTTCKIQQVKYRIFAIPWRHPPTVSSEATVHIDTILNLHLLIILLLSISMLIFTHFSPNYRHFSKQYIVYITTREKKNAKF